MIILSILAQPFTIVDSSARTATKQLLCEGWHQVSITNISEDKSNYGDPQVRITFENELGRIMQWRSVYGYKKQDGAFVKDSNGKRIVCPEKTKACAEISSRIFVACDLNGQALWTNLVGHSIMIKVANYGSSVEVTDWQPIAKVTDDCPF